MRRRYWFLPLICLAAFVLVVSTAHAIAPTTRTVYVTVLDGKGAAVTDLAAADFSVKEGGKDYALTKAELATAPIQVALVVDDNGMGVFRPAVASFIQALLTKGEFEIVTVVDRVQRATEFT